MRTLIIGASGLVGSHLLAEATARGGRTQGTYRNFPVDGLVRLDLADGAAMQSVLKSFRPDWVVHAAGWSWVDGCEQDPTRAFGENCDQPAALARQCRDLGIRFAYLSTTYVFDGKCGPYSETDVPNPINIYSKSKWAAEQAIQEILEGQALIPRVVWVWGREAQEKNFVHQVIRALRESRTLTIPSDQVGNPTWGGDLAWWMLGLMERGVTGVWNLAGGPDSCTREEWFCQIRDAARVAGLVPVPHSDSPGYVAATTAEMGQMASRPLHAGVLTGKVVNILPRMTRPSSALDCLRFPPA